MSNANEMTTANQTQYETVEEATTLSSAPEAQVVGQVGSAEAQPEEELRAANAEAVAHSIAEAKALLDAVGHNGFILIGMNGQGQANAMLAGDYATVVHGVHTAVCALGSVVKQVQGEADGNPEKHASVENFNAGAAILTVHHGMLAKMHSDAQAEAANTTNH